MGIEWLEQRREQLDLTHEQVAAFLGRERSTTSKIMRGKSGFTPDDIPRLARALRVSVYDLLVGLGILEGSPVLESPNYVTISEDNLAAVLEAVLEGASSDPVPEEWIRTIVGVSRKVSERVRQDDRLAKNRPLLKGFALGALSEGRAPPP